jgi:hypothetical protein
MYTYLEERCRQKDRDRGRESWRQGKVWQDNAWQGKVRQDKGWQGKWQQGKSRQCKSGKARWDMARDDKELQGNDDHCQLNSMTSD